MKDFLSVAGIVLVLWIAIQVSAEAQDPSVKECLTYKEATKDMLTTGKHRNEKGQWVLEAPYTAIGAFIDNHGRKYFNLLINMDNGRWVILQSNVETSCVEGAETGDMFILRHPSKNGSYETEDDFIDT